MQAGNPKYEPSQNLPDFQFAAYAKMLGLEGYRISSAEQIEETLDLAMAADRPVVVEAVTDPNVPLLPPHISALQAKNFFTSLVKGNIDAWSMVKQTYKDVVDNYFPGK